jgi:hypothetical protein
MLIDSQELRVDVGPFNMEKIDFVSMKAGRLALLGRELETPPTPYGGTIADLLLSSPSTAIMHFGLLRRPLVRGCMLAANYHRGHSEGDHLIVIQDPYKQEAGQLYLKWGPGSDQIIRRRQLFADKVYPFEEFPTNPDKIHDYYVHTGDTSEALDSFLEKGYTLDPSV